MSDPSMASTGSSTYASDWGSTRVDEGRAAKSGCACTREMREGTRGLGLARVRRGGGGGCGVATPLTGPGPHPHHGLVWLPKHDTLHMPG